MSLENKLTDEVGGRVILTPMSNDYKSITIPFLDELVKLISQKNIHSKYELIKIKDHPGTTLYPVYEISYIFSLIK
jgi:hypothetical protein